MENAEKTSIPARLTTAFPTLILYPRTAVIGALEPEIAKIMAKLENELEKGVSVGCDIYFCEASTCPEIAKIMIDIAQKLPSRQGKGDRFFTVQGDSLVGYMQQFAALTANYQTARVICCEYTEYERVCTLARITMLENMPFIKPIVFDWPRSFASKATEIAFGPAIEHVCHLFPLVGKVRSGILRHMTSAQTSAIHLIMDHLEEAGIKFEEEHSIYQSPQDRATQAA